MPHLRMFLDEHQIDAIYIPDVLLQSISLNRLIEEEKQKLIKKHAANLKKTERPSFILDLVPSTINTFRPLQIKKSHSDNL